MHHDGEAPCVWRGVWQQVSGMQQEQEAERSHLSHIDKADRKSERGGGGMERRGEGRREDPPWKKDPGVTMRTFWRMFQRDPEQY